MSDPVTVSCYGDLIRDPDLNVEAADAIAHELTRGRPFAALLPAWLITDKSVRASERHDRVVAGDVNAETEKAYLVDTGGGEAWLPKSVIRVYTLAEDADIIVPEATTTATEEGAEW